MGKEQLGQMIDQRLGLTDRIRSEVDRRPNLVLLGGTGINSCMMIYVPTRVQKHFVEHKIRLSDADLEKINKLTVQLQDDIRQDGSYYIHGLSLESCPHENLIEPDKKLFVLRTLNGNPRSSKSHIMNLLDKVEEVGEALFRDGEYFCMGDGDEEGSFTSHIARVRKKLSRKLFELFGEKDFVAMVYGSFARCNNAIISNIDLMVFGNAAEPSQSQYILSIFRSIVHEEGLSINVEVSTHRKLLVTFKFANEAAESESPLDGVEHVSSIHKTGEYLESDEILKRPVFNVLATPNRVIAASPVGYDILRGLETKASRKLVGAIRQLGELENITVDKFGKLAISNGDRSGKKYLGHKSRQDVRETLRTIVYEVQYTPLE
ncbi:glutamic acid decarboxylase [Fusarium beomiforme]|uniref:Glutamic acid decarboxylase n=1 Tax=Fusarium beomiforme TaxID=44412 RepID=A0A9P5AHZ1_9HYPO|nr:glutamic acid decarboxylase [Fusarium beomiforme]